MGSGVDFVTMTIRVMRHESVRVRWVRGVHGVRRVENPAQNLSEVASPGSSRKREIAPHYLS